MRLHVSRILMLLVALSATVSRADFGEYRAHEHLGNTLAMTTTQGQLRVTAVDDAAFEVHYIEPGVKQLPSFALAPTSSSCRRLRWHRKIGTLPPSRPRPGGR
jgi:hypothetical protein